MSTGWGSSLPDYSGGDGGERRDEEESGTRGIFAQDSSAQDPYAPSPYAQSPYAADPFAADGSGQHAGGRPYGAPSTGGPAFGGTQPAGPAYGGPAGYGSFAPPPPTSGSAIAGLVLGILGLVMCLGVTSPFGVFFSYRGMKESEPSATQTRSGRGLAIAGLVTSLVGLLILLFFVVWIAFVVIVGLSAESTY